jgi:transposase
MLHAGLDLSRKKVDVCLLSDRGEHIDQLAVPPDVDSLKTLARRIDEVHREPVRAVVESMTGARLIHDTLEAEGWDVEIADAQQVKGLAPLALKTDRIDSLVLAVLSHRDLVPAIWLPDPRVREERELARFRMHLVKHKSALKCRIHSTLINFGRPCPVTDLFGVEGRRLLARLDVPEPWRSNVTASIELIDDLERQIDQINRRLREGQPDHPYVPLLLSTLGRWEEPDVAKRRSKELAERLGKTTLVPALKAIENSSGSAVDQRSRRASRRDVRRGVGRFLFAQERRDPAEPHGFASSSRAGLLCRRGPGL